MKQYCCVLGVLVSIFLLLNTAESASAVLKSIKSEDGDTIMCTDIYKQPTLGYAALNNSRNFEMQPPKFIMTSMRTNATQITKAKQVWQKAGKCPSGTIPILRTRENDQVELALEHETSPTCRTEYAGVETYETVYGVRADLNVWPVKVEANEWSISSINVYNENGSYIQYGWMVSPTLYQDDGQARLFVRTVDPHREIDCFNLRCAGFVQISDQYAFGAALTPLSQYSGVQCEISLTLYKDEMTQRWCAMYGESILGYWPLDKFPQFKNGRAAFWGGQICNRHTGYAYTTTQMGSGRLPLEGWGNSAYAHDMEVMGSDQQWQRPQQDSIRYNLSSDCYKVDLFDSKDGKMSTFFGGTGGATCCGTYCQ